ncbi:MAG: hypothetical protein WD971_08955 [Pirellulales bacterium]
MRTRIAGTVLAFAWMAACAHVEPVAAQIWKHFVPASYVEEVPPGDTKLTQDKGPWLIMVASFDGDGAAEHAQELADELRTRHQLTVYVHDHTFDHSDGKNTGRGLDNYGAPLRTRYQQEQAHQYAVLVGDFESNEDPETQRTLKRIKSLPSKVLAGDTPDSAIEEVRSVMGKLSGRSRGPMSSAFITRNPLLPREYFVPKGVDDFIAKMNRGVANSLLDCPGRYTVQVATFRGKSVLQSGDSKPKETGGLGWMWAKDKSEPLVEAAENAHLLVEELRKHGYEAYEFHDRMESFVAIGSFDRVGERLANGQLTPTPEVQKIIMTFGAAYDTPADPLTGDDIRQQRRAEELKQQFSQMLTSHDGQIAAGMNPKHVKIMHGKAVERIIPFDIYPHAIEVPKRSVSGAYSGGSG